MVELSLDDIEFIKILAISDATILEKEMNGAARHRLDKKIGVILREYYQENTMYTGTNWNEKFNKSGISVEQGKSAIACARRLGIDIS
ncbi:MAG: hypothetical protein ACE5GR_00805 [Nitrosopumilus sp.]